MGSDVGGDLVQGDMTAGAAAAGTAGTAPSDVRWLDEEQQLSWRAYLLGSARLQDALNRQLESEAGVSLSEYEVLVRLSEAPDRTVRMSDLAASVMHSRSRLTHTVSRMERRGLVRRETCAADGRGVNCVLTDDGFALLERSAPGHVHAVRQNLVDLLSEEELRVLGRVMGLVAAGPQPGGAAGPQSGGAAGPQSGGAAGPQSGGAGTA